MKSSTNALTLEQPVIIKDKARCIWKPGKPVI